MPTYDYHCLKCGKKFELQQRMSEDPIKKCIYCKGKVERLIGAGAGLIFKGSGFYITDYKKSSVSTDAPKEKTKETKTESAPAPKVKDSESKKSKEKN